MSHGPLSRGGAKNSPAVKPREGESGEMAGPASFDMADLRPERTGLPFVVFIPQTGEARHDARIKLARAAKVRPSEMSTVTVCPTPRIIRGEMNAQALDLVSRWIELSRSVLVDYWNGDVEYTEDVLNAIQPIGDR